MYKIVAQHVRTDGVWTSSSGLPTFYIDTDSSSACKAVLNGMFGRLLGPGETVHCGCCTEEGNDYFTFDHEVPLT